MKLYEIEEALDALINEDGELIDAEAFDALNIERDKKLEGIFLGVKNCKAEAEAIKAEIKALTDRKKALENQAERLADFGKWYLNGEKFKTARVAVSYRKSSSVQIEEGTVLAEEYLRYKDPEPNKDAIKADLAAGVIIDGCSLVEKQSIIIK